MYAKPKVLTLLHKDSIYFDYFPLVDKSQPDVHSISNLLQLLSNNVYIKKSKNVEVLHLAAEVVFVYCNFLNFRKFKMLL